MGYKFKGIKGRAYAGDLYTKTAHEDWLPLETYLRSLLFAQIIPSPLGIKRKDYLTELIKHLFLAGYDRVSVKNYFSFCSYHYALRNWYVSSPDYVARINNYCHIASTWARRESLRNYLLYSAIGGTKPSLERESFITAMRTMGYRRYRFNEEGDDILCCVDCPPFDHLSKPYGYVEIVNKFSEHVQKKYLSLYHNNYVTQEEMDICLRLLNSQFTSQYLLALPYVNACLPPQEKHCTYFPIVGGTMLHYEKKVSALAKKPFGANRIHWQQEPLFFSFKKQGREHPPHSFTYLVEEAVRARKDNYGQWGFFIDKAFGVEKREGLKSIIGYLLSKRPDEHIVHMYSVNLDGVRHNHFFAPVRIITSALSHYRNVLILRGDKETDILQQMEMQWDLDVDIVVIHNFGFAPTARLQHLASQGIVKKKRKKQYPHHRPKVLLFTTHETEMALAAAKRLSTKTISVRSMHPRIKEYGYPFIGSTLTKDDWRDINYYMIECWRKETNSRLGINTQ